MHWCQDETYAALSTLPVIGYYYKKVHSWYHNKTQHKCHHQGCSATHSEHPNLTAGEFVHMAHAAGQDMLGLCNDIEFITLHFGDSQIITMAEVDIRYGQLATILLMFDRPLLNVKEFQPETEFTWLVSKHDTLLACFQNRLFVWDGEKWEPELILELVKEDPINQDVPLDKAAQIILMFMENEKIYNSIMDWDKSKAFSEAEKFLETISQK